jgi:hypothetical protein
MNHGYRSRDLQWNGDWLYCRKRKLLLRIVADERYRTCGALKHPTDG